LDKAELRHYRDLVLEAKELEEEIDALRDKVTSRTWPDGLPHGSGSGDKLGNVVAKIADLSKLLECKQQALIYQRYQIESAIEQLDPVERRLIRLRYVKGLSWERVCVGINYSWRETHRKHSEALKKMAHFGT
jgi:DNA-directed RNA polymerase specialized sigma24 family protein